MTNELQAIRAELLATQRDLAVIVEERDALLAANIQLQEERDLANESAKEAIRTLQECAPIILRAEEAHGND